MNLQALSQCVFGNPAQKGLQVAAAAVAAAAVAAVIVAVVLVVVAAIAVVLVVAVANCRSLPLNSLRTCPHTDARACKPHAVRQRERGVGGGGKGEGNGKVLGRIGARNMSVSRFMSCFNGG